jgi:hypothetical protein
MMNVIARFIASAIAALAVQPAAQAAGVEAHMKERGAKDADLPLGARSSNRAIAPVSPDEKNTHDDVAKLVARRGAKISDVRPLASPPGSEIIPAIYYEKGTTVQSCGLVIKTRGKQDPSFVELLSPESGLDFPQCLNITSIVPFKLANRNYVSVEYISRETRNENYRSFHYLYRDETGDFIVDRTLTNVVPSLDTTIAEAMPTPAKRLDGIRGARLAYLTAAFPQWQIERRDFISDANSSFAVFEDKKNNQCHLAVEAGGRPLAASSEEYTHDEKCIGVLASSRLVRPTITYYLELFKTGPNKQRVGIMSATPEAVIRIEKSLSDEINRAGAPKDVKTARAALARLLQD